MASNTLNLPTEETLQSIATTLSNMQGNVSGVKGNEESVYRTGQVNLTAANIGALPSNTTYVSSVNGGSGAVTGIATQQELNEVRGIAEGAGAAMSFANYAVLVSDFNSAADDDYKLGQSIYINTLDVPDLWIYEVSNISILYYYTTDEAFTDLLKQQGYVQIGYYKVAALETQKVDLSNYVSLDGAQTIIGVKSFTDFSLINDYTNGKTLTSYLSGKVDTNADSIFNVMNASDIAVSNILTQAQIDVITNGKPTIIKGTFLDYNNPILCSVRTASNYGNRSYVGAWLGSKQAGLATYAVFTIMNTGQIKIEKALIYYNLQASNEMMAYFGDVTASRNLYFQKGYSTGTVLQLGWNNSNIAIEASAATFKVACNNFISRNGTNLSDIGSSTVSWKDLYLAGKINPNTSSYGLTLPDTTSYTANKEIATTDQVFNVINASDITSNTFTQAQYDLVTNGKPTLIIGTLLGLTNPILLPPMGTSYKRGKIIGCSSASIYIETLYNIDGTTLIIDLVDSRTKIAFDSGNQRTSITNADLQGVVNKNNSGYGLTLPSTSSYTANKEIATTDIISDAYDNTATYVIGDLVIYNNTLYRCTTAITTAETWDSTHWTATTIADEMVNLTAAQTISGAKTFNSVIKQEGGIQFDTNKHIDIKNSSGSLYYRIGETEILPFGTPTIGSSSRLLNNIYLSGSLKDETNSVSVALLSGVSGAYATNSTTELKYSSINNISISADTTYTLATAPTGTYPEYKANITNTDTTNAITITLPSGTVIKGNVTISSNTFEIPADSSVEVNIQNGKALVVNWGA